MEIRASKSDRVVLKSVAGLAIIVVIVALLTLLIGAYASRLSGEPSNKGEAGDFAVDASALQGVTEEGTDSVSPIAETDTLNTQSPALTQLNAELMRIGTGLSSQLGIAMVDIETGEAAHFNGNRLMPQQSVSKLWVAMTALDKVDKGGLDLSEQGTVERADLTVFHQPIRKKVLANGSFTSSYGDFMKRALVGSDNTANDMLLKRVGGPEAVRAMIAARELKSIRFGPGERIMQSELAGLKWDASYSIGKTFFEVRKTVAHDRRRKIFDDYVNDPVDGASALAIGNALALLAKGELLSPQSTQVLLGHLRDAKSGPNRLKGGLPQGWQIAHKTGTGQVLDIVPPGVIGEQAGYNDIGILTAPDGARYSVAVLIGNTRKPVPERMDMMHEVVAAIADYHTKVRG